MTATKVTPSGTAAPPKPKFGSTVALPTQKSAPETDIKKFSYFIYGKQGIGKTSFTAQFPNALHIMFEPGAKTEEIYQVHPKSWKEVQQYANLVNKSDQYDYVIIDTIDLMFDMCCKDLCKEKGVEILKDIGFGDGYNMAGNRFRDILIQLHSTHGLVMLAHDKEKMKQSENDTDYIIPSTMKRGAETVAKWVDLCGHYYIDSGGKRKLRIRASKDREAKNRIKHMFKYTDGTLIKDIPMGSSEKESYDNFLLAFNNKMENKAPAKKPALTFAKKENKK